MHLSSFRLYEIQEQSSVHAVASAILDKMITCPTLIKVPTVLSPIIEAGSVIELGTLSVIKATID